MPVTNMTPFKYVYLPFLQCKHVGMGYWLWQHTQLHRGSMCSAVEHGVECRNQSVHRVEMELAAVVRQQTHGMNMHYVYKQVPSLFTYSITVKFALFKQYFFQFLFDYS